MIKQSVIDQVIDRVSIYDIVKEDVDLKPSGNDFIGLCPFHNDHNPSFRVSPQKNICKCFVCNEGGSPITYYMKQHGCGFIEAIRALAPKYDIDIDEEEETVISKEECLHKENLCGLNRRVLMFYMNLVDSYPEVVEYLESRLGKDYKDYIDVGFAPNVNKQLLNWAEKNCEDIDSLIELGWLKRNRQGWLEDKLYNRIIFPINNTYSMMVGYTARTISKDESANHSKYINSPDNYVYHKSDEVFGLDVAKAEAKRQNYMYLVEGAVDALKMRSLGIENTVAALGGEWTDNMLRSIKKYTDNICFINDADASQSNGLWGAGIAFVLKNGAKAVKMGFDVSVKEIATLPGNIKQDPASFFTSINRMDDLIEEEFVIWHAKKLFSVSNTTHRVKKAMSQSAELLSYIADDVEIEYCLKELNRIYKGKDLWRKSLAHAKKMRDEENKKTNSNQLEKYGFIIKNGCYFGNKGSYEGEWSNFLLTPLFHIKDNESPKRTFEVRNTEGQRDTIEFSMDELCSITKLKQKLEGLGNYMWMTTDANFGRVKRFLFANMKVAIPIKQMGWNQHGFFAYENTVWRNGNFYDADEYGMCTFEDGSKWYIPASSSAYKYDEIHYDLEKRFVYKRNDKVTTSEFTKEFVNVFGENGMFGLCFYLSSLFHDIVRSKTRKFPILNLCGPKGTGKTEMASALMSLFVTYNKAPNLRNATIAALNHDISLLSNTLFHLDEYKNTLKFVIIEFLKGLYDCVGRKKMTGNNYDNSIMTSVKCGVIMSGQDIPTVDIALLHRCIFLHFSKSDFTKSELDRFNHFYECYKDGVTHINIEFLKYRDLFESRYSENYSLVLRDITNGTNDMGLESRITENWARIIASFLCLEDCVEFPFTYEYLLTCAIDHIVMQNNQCRKSDEMAKFWKNFRYLVSEGLIYERSDYQIKTLSSFKPVRGTVRIFDHPTQVLLLNPARVFNLAYKAGFTAGDKPIDNETLGLYMENSHEYLGKKGSVRFDKIVNGVTQYTVDDKGKRIKDQSVLQALVFNVEVLCEKYGFEFGNDTIELSAVEHMEDKGNLGKWTKD